MASNQAVVGIPKEVKVEEYRVSTTPAGVSVLVAAGAKVVVEKGAGEGSGFPDEEYVQAGAEIVGTHEEVFERATIIVKVKEPIECEWPLLKPHHVVWTFFHLAGSRALTDAMLNSKATCIAYETVEKDGMLPVLAPMSEIAGRLSIQQGMTFLEKHNGGSGMLLAGVPGVAPGNVVVIGGGVSGQNAAIVAAGLGARVVVLDINLNRLRAISSVMPNNVQTVFSSPAAIEQYLKVADVAVGAALVAGARTPVLVTKAMLESMKPGSVFVDVAIDQGGMTEMSRATTHTNPVFKVGETTMYCVANMPGCVPRTSTIGIANAALPYTVDLVKHGWQAAAIKDPGFRKGVSVVDGQITNEAVAQFFDLPYTDVRTLLPGYVSLSSYSVDGSMMDPMRTSLSNTTRSMSVGCVGKRVQPMVRPKMAALPAVAPLRVPAAPRKAGACVARAGRARLAF